MFVGTFTKEQSERLAKAKKTGKYGSLQTWRELFTFMHTLANAEQFYQIAQWAGRYNRGEGIRLPLSLNSKSILMEIVTDKHDEIVVRQTIEEIEEEVYGGTVFGEAKHSEESEPV